LSNNSSKPTTSALASVIIGLDMSDCFFINKKFKV
jgi:hypothetical protein